VSMLTTAIPDNAVRSAMLATAALLVDYNDLNFHL